MMHVGSLHISEDGTQLNVSQLTILIEPGFSHEVEPRIVSILKEAVAAWEANPGGEVQFGDVMLGRTFIGQPPG